MSSIGQLVDADGDDEVLDAGADLLSLLQTHFLSPFYVFASSYSDLVVRPLEMQLSAAKKANKAKADSLERCQAALLSFTGSLFDDFFALVRRELSRRGNLVGSPFPSLSSHMAAIGRFTSQVSVFQQSMERVAPLVPRAGLQLRVKEIIDFGIRHAVESVVELTQSAVLDTLLKLHADVSRFDALRHARQLLDALSLPPTELHRAFASSEAASASVVPSGLPSPAALATAIRVRVEECLQILAALLDTKAYMREDTAPGQRRSTAALHSAPLHSCTTPPRLDPLPPHPLTSHLSPPLLSAASSQPWPMWRTLSCRGSAAVLCVDGRCGLRRTLPVPLLSPRAVCGGAWRVSAAEVAERDLADASGAEERGPCVHRPASPRGRAECGGAAAAAGGAVLPRPLSALPVPRHQGGAPVSAAAQPGPPLSPTLSTAGPSSHPPISSSALPACARSVVRSLRKQFPLPPGKVGGPRLHLSARSSSFRRQRPLCPALTRSSPRGAVAEPPRVVPKEAVGSHEVPPAVDCSPASVSSRASVELTPRTVGPLPLPVLLSVRARSCCWRAMWSCTRSPCSTAYGRRRSVQRLHTRDSSASQPRPVTDLDARPAVLRCCAAMQLAVPASAPSASSVVECSGWVLSCHRRLLSMQVELCELLPRKKGGAGGGEEGTGSASGRSTAASTHSASSSRLSGSSSSASSAHRDIARLFSVKVPTYSPVRMNRIDPLVAVVRIALQCLIECTRMRHFPKPEAQDVSAQPPTLTAAVTPPSAASTHLHPPCCVWRCPLRV